MALPRREDPLHHMLRYIREQRVAHAQKLAIGAWPNEAAAREFVGRIKSIDDIESEMEKLSRPDGGFSPTTEGKDI